MNVPSSASCLPGSRRWSTSTRVPLSTRIQPGAYDAGLPYTSRVLAENLVRRCDPALLDRLACRQTDRAQTRNRFPLVSRRAWFATTSSARPPWSIWPGCATPSPPKGGDPAEGQPGGAGAVDRRPFAGGRVRRHSIPHAFAKNRAIEDRRNEDRFHFIEWTKHAVRERRRDPGGQRDHAPDQPGENVARDVGAKDGVAFPDTLRRHRQPHAPRGCAGRDRNRRGRARSGERDARAAPPGCGCRISSVSRLAGERQAGITATDIVLALTEFLRQPESGGSLSGVLRRGHATKPHPRRPRDHFQHVHRNTAPRRRCSSIDEQTLVYLQAHRPQRRSR